MNESVKVTPDIISPDGTEYIFWRGDTNFEHAIAELKGEYCDAIFGPQGGILVPDRNNCLVYRASKEPIYVSLENYLDKWRMLREILK